MSQFSMRLDNNFKKETQDNFKKMGLDMTTATKMFYIFVNQHGYLPFVPSTGKSELDQADYEADHHIYAGSVNSIEEFKKEMNNED